MDNWDKIDINHHTASFTHFLCYNYPNPQNIKVELMKTSLSLRTIPIVSLLLGFIYSGAYGLDYSACRAYYKQATSVVDSTRIYSVLYQNKPHLIAFSPSPLRSSRIIKHDPFTGLYLFSGKLAKSYRLKPLDTFAHTLPLAGVNATQAIAGSITNFEKGIFDLGKFSTTLPKDSVISTICYQSYGISAYGQYFIPKILIDRFLSPKGGQYGDIGVRVSANIQSVRDQHPKGVIIEQVDVFFPHKPLLPKDRILSINGHAITSLADFEWLVADLEPRSKAQVKFVRNGRVLEAAVQVDRRYGGGILRDTFFERYGVIIDKDFVIRSIGKPLPFALSQLSVGDKFIWIDKTPIKKDSDFWHFRQLFSQAGLRGQVELLLLHDGVEIFLRSPLR